MEQFLRLWENLPHPRDRGIRQKKLPGWPGFARSKNFPGGCTQLELTETLLTSSNSEHQRQQQFCLNCLQGFHSKASRYKHFECCIDHEAVRIDMPEPNSSMRFRSGQYQVKVPFIIYTNFKAILQSSKDETELDSETPYTREINCHIPSGFCM